MLNPYELEFINKFIVNEKKNRIIYEFSNMNKRKDALMRFAHDAGGQECGQSTTLHIICFTWSWLGRKGCWEVQDGFLPAPG